MMDMLDYLKMQMETEYDPLPGEGPSHTWRVLGEAIKEIERLRAELACERQWLPIDRLLGIDKWDTKDFPNES